MAQGLGLRMRAPCSECGRPGEIDHPATRASLCVDCYIAPISCVQVASQWPWSACDKKGPTVKNLNKITRCLVGGDENACNNRGLVKENYADLQATYHFINLVPLLSEKPQEYAGHNGPVAGLWTWFALFNSLEEATAHIGTGRPGSSCEHCVSRH